MTLFSALAPKLPLANAGFNTGQSPLAVSTTCSINAATCSTQTTSGAGAAKMASKTKNRKSQSARNQRRQRKEQKRKQRKSRGSTSSPGSLTARKHQQQVATLLPKPWEGESVFDVAVFDESARASLDEADQALVRAVAEALEMQAAGQPEDAEQCVAHIPRKSPMSDWRMLIRGLSHWYKNHSDAAKKLWSRLDHHRRPARIARTLQLARQDDLTTLTAGNSIPAIEEDAMRVDPSNASKATAVDSTEQDTAHSMPLDKALLQAAKVVRKTRIDRSAIRLARNGLADNIWYEPEFDSRNEALILSPEQIVWLKQFARNFRGTEPDLVRSLELLALERASQQHYVDIFEAATKAFRGPAHDPDNTLRSYFYHSKPLLKNKKAESTLRRYRMGELAANKHVSAPLRNALLSELALSIAESIIQDTQIPDNPFGPPGYQPVLKDHEETIRTEYRQSIEACPHNILAHEGYTNWIKNQIEMAEGDKQLLDQLQQEQINAMQDWANGVPDEEIPRQFLAQTLLQGKQPELAEPHIQWLLASRPSDPRIAAMPWSLQLHKMMQLCRRKSNLAEARTQLEQVFAQWPAWLSSAWQPYLTAAWLLRSDRNQEYEQLRESICAESGYARDSAPDACMLLAAAQKLHVPATSLKPLRQAVEASVENRHLAPKDDIVAVGSFFWSLNQIGTRYPAMRSHAGKLGRYLLYILSEETDLSDAIEHNTTMQEALLWTGEERFWSEKRGLSTPYNFIDCTSKSIPVAAAFLRAYVKTTVTLLPDKSVQNAAALLNASYRSVADPFNRQWYADILSEYQVKERIYKSRQAEAQARDSRFYDSDCLCPECTARRIEQQEFAAQGGSSSPEYTKEPAGPSTQAELF